MRLRRKLWIDEAIKDYTDILYMEEPTRLKGKWNTLFPEPENPIHVEFGTGKGRFISRMASVHPDINYIGMEVQEGVIYYAAKKTAEMDPPVANVRLILGDVKHIQDIFAQGEVSVIYLNFSDPWPKARHAKRRLTYREFLKNMNGYLKKVEKSVLKQIIKTSLIFLWRSSRKWDGRFLSLLTISTVNR